MNWKNALAVLFLQGGALAGAKVPGVYVINLAFRHDRMEFIQGQLNGMKYTRIDAADTQHSQEEIAAGRVAVNETFRDPGFGRRMKLGEVGCALSHIRAWEAISEKHDEDEYAIVLEDDAEFVSPAEYGDGSKTSIEDWLSEIVSAASEQKADFVFLSRKELITRGKKTENENISDLLQTCVYSYWTVAYMIRAGAARRLVDDAEAYMNNLIPVDEYLAIIYGSFDAEGSVDEPCPTGRKYCKGRRDPRFPNARISCFTVKENIIWPHDSFAVQSDTESSNLVASGSVNDLDKDRLLVITVATDESHYAFQRLWRSAEYFGYNLKNIGEGRQWTDYGTKLLLVKEFLDNLPESDDDRLILFTDGHDTVFQAEPEKMFQLYREHPADVVFGAELACWPEEDLCREFIELIGEIEGRAPPSRFRYVNSGTYIGKAKILRQLMQEFNGEESFDDQAYFYLQFIEFLQHKKDMVENGRRSNTNDDHHFRIGLDYTCEMFLPMSFMEAEDWVMDEGFELHNEITDTSPVLLHGNGLSIRQLIGIGNYVAGGYASFYGTMQHVQIPEVDVEIYPLAIGLFLLGTPFESEFLDGVLSLDINKRDVDLYVYYSAGSRLRVNPEVQQAYRSYTVLSPGEPSECVARASFTELAGRSDVRFLFMVDSDTILTRNTTVLDLATWNQSAVAGLAQRENSLWSNFWTDMAYEGWYQRGFDAYELYRQERIGLWQVPFARSPLLIRRDSSVKLSRLYKKHADTADWCSIKVCEESIDDGVGFFADNRHMYATLLGQEGFVNADAPFPELYEAHVSPSLWAKRYLVPKYEETVFEEVCPDVYGAKVFTKQFCDEMIATTEVANNWSSGDHDDPRIGGYENFPTQDIHMNQFLWEEQWVYVVKNVLRPWILTKYDGVKFEGEINIAFVIHFNMEGQKDLDAHNDASLVTTTVVLNDDFTGGGVEFTRYNCSHVSNTPGFLTMHPGKVTHKHRSLPITSGQRYVLVSFNEN